MKMHDMRTKPDSPPVETKKYYPFIEFDESQLKGIKNLPIDKKIKLIVVGKIKRIGRNYDGKLSTSIEIRKAGFKKDIPLAARAARALLNTNNKWNY